jgi:hypothetical protein
MEQRLLDGLGIQPAYWNQDNPRRVFGEICSTSTVLMRVSSEVKWVPTVIFEVEGTTSTEILKEVYRTSKELSCDEVQARCIIVLSDENAALSMTSDPGRQRYVWVPNFTVYEAIVYLYKFGFMHNEMHDGKARMVIDLMGTRPMELRSLATSGIDPKDYVEGLIRTSIVNVEDCLAKGKEYRTVFEEMLKEENNDGMYESDVKKLCYQTRPDIVLKDILEGPAVKEYHILSYDIERNRFQFHSRTMYHATKRFLNHSVNQTK